MNRYVNCNKISRNSCNYKMISIHKLFAYTSYLFKTKVLGRAYCQTGSFDRINSLFFENVMYFSKL